MMHKTYTYQIWVSKTPKKPVSQVDRRQTQQQKMPKAMKLASEKPEDNSSIDEDFMEFEDKEEIQQPELKVPAKLKMKT